MSAVQPFAGVADDVEISPDDFLVEMRREFTREARFLLREWELIGSQETLGRLLQVLDDLALIVRSGRG